MAKFLPSLSFLIYQMKRLSQADLFLLPMHSAHKCRIHVDAIPSKKPKILHCIIHLLSACQDPTHTPHMGYCGRGGASRITEGPPVHPQVCPNGTADKLCRATKVTFPAPSSDGRLNSSFSSFGAKEGREDPRGPGTEQRDSKGRQSRPRL